MSSVALAGVLTSLGLRFSSVSGVSRASLAPLTRGLNVWCLKPEAPWRSSGCLRPHRLSLSPLSPGKAWLPFLLPGGRWSGLSWPGHRSPPRPRPACSANPEAGAALHLAMGGALVTTGFPRSAPRHLAFQPLPNTPSHGRTGCLEQGQEPARDLELGWA